MHRHLERVTHGGGYFWPSLKKVSMPRSDAQLRADFKRIAFQRSNIEELQDVTETIDSVLAPGFLQIVSDFNETELDTKWIWTPATGGTIDFDEGCVIIETGTGTPEGGRLDMTVAPVIMSAGMELYFKLDTESTTQQNVSFGVEYGGSEYIRITRPDTASPANWFVFTNDNRGNSGFTETSTVGDTDRHIFQIILTENNTVEVYFDEALLVTRNFIPNGSSGRLYISLLNSAAANKVMNIDRVYAIFPET